MTEGTVQVPFFVFLPHKGRPIQRQNKRQGAVFTALCLMLFTQTARPFSAGCRPRCTCLRLLISNKILDVLLLLLELLKSDAVILSGAVAVLNEAVCSETVPEGAEA